MTVLVFILLLVAVFELYVMVKMSRNLKKRDDAISELKAYKSKLEIKNSKLESDNNDLANDAVKMRAHIDEKNVVIMEVSNQLEKQIEDLKSNNKRLSGDLIHSGNDIKMLKDELAEKNVVVNDLAKANKELADKVSELNKKNSSLLSSSGGYEKSNKNLRENLNTLTEEHNKNVRMYNELKDEYDKVVSELEDLKKTEPEELGYDDPPIEEYVEDSKGNKESDAVCSAPAGVEDCSQKEEPIEVITPVISKKSKNKRLKK